MTRVWQTLLAGVFAVAFAAAGIFFYQWRMADAPPDPAEAGRRVLAASLMGIDDKLQPFEQWRAGDWPSWGGPDPASTTPTPAVRGQDRTRSARSRA